MHCRFLLSAFLLTMLPSLPVAAQVVREDGTKSIGGVLIPSQAEYVDWIFRSAGGQILFASLDAEIYLARAHEGTMLAQAEPGGCEGGGPGRFYLQVNGPQGEVCYAERPAPPPGWQRDPRMACVLPRGASTAPVSYTLRVGLLPGEPGEPVQESYPFLLNVSLRAIAPSGVAIQEAIGRSGNAF